MNFRRLFPPYTGGFRDMDYWNKEPYRMEEMFRDHVLKKIDKVYYWIKDRTFTRHHIINLGEPGWCDVDEAMFHACFILLGRFVE